MTALTNKHILLGVTGGIAAYKSAVLARRLMDEGAAVQVIMTPGAQAFVQPLTFQALTGNPVRLDLLDPAAEAAMGHIELARWADAILIAPASANTLARLAHGMASDLLSTVCLATEAPIHVAPAMNRLMWQNTATIANCQTLASRGVLFFGPAEGAQACGETGAGRMLEPEEIRDALLTCLHPDARSSEVGSTTPADRYSHTGRTASRSTAGRLSGKRILITAGPTRESIDPVRYISNHSSGKMGFALAEEALKAGAQVTLIAGPVSLQSAPGIRRIDVISADDMLRAVLAQAGSADVFISVAAVSDYRLEQVMDQKIKKNNDHMALSLVRNPDILKSVASLTERPFCVGFAAETEQLEAHARAKMQSKRLDMIAANHVGQPANPVFGTDTNSLEVYWPGKHGHAHIPAASKHEVAASLLSIIAERLKARESHDDKCPPGVQR
ncbi:MAG: bifunctional phosphopantothenoylcysteine decarboxylase/phosphopantothenate--cysteine ligase CoaBC [Granulosicoccus sp.]|nr:bifunctional phosphopantothenoylcysteine decarboxylase/phosphopantothenate--cysteine ligase CoaBC [Granulosicoccus sp.]